jgi:RHS repeat-associated protein
MQRNYVIVTIAAVAVVVLGTTRTAAAVMDPFAEARVQPSELKAPERGSLVGQYAGTAFGAADVSRGGFTLPGPFMAPAARGPVLADPFPSYSPEGGLTEWGMGFSVSLTIQRWRAVGEIDYQGDDLQSPWGRLRRGEDGAYYAAGLASTVRVEMKWSGALAPRLVALLPDGGRWTFGGSVRVDTDRGTYAWYLEEAQDLLGHRALFDYVPNASGRQFVTRVRYGGRLPAPVQEITFAYEPVPRVFVDYRSSKPLELDRRVRSVAVRAMVPGTEQWRERWRYDLRYLDGGLGPPFFLAEVKQTFASGASAPVTRYTYNGAAEALEAARFRRAAVLDGAVAMFGVDVFQPENATLLDWDADGRLDFEHRSRNTLFVQAGRGYSIVEQPPAPQGAPAVCRASESPWNEPRKILRLGPDFAGHHVLDLHASGDATSTEVTVCTPAGARVARLDLLGDWTAANNARVVDLDRDHRPDLIRVFAGGYETLRNASTPAAIRFAAGASGALSPAFTPAGVWIHDMNGDGGGDIVASADGALVVWYGRGGMQFDSVGVAYPVTLASGTELPALGSYQLAFADVTHDGQADLLLSAEGFVALFANTGAGFREVSFPAQSFFDGTAAPAVVADLGGTGGVGLTTSKGGAAYAIALDAPGTGLMNSADDGKGTVLRFEYAWSAPAPGAYQRHPLLAQLRVETSGDGVSTHDYVYSGQVTHPGAKSLLGFEGVTIRDGGTTTLASFRHDEERAGLLLASTVSDVRSPLVRRFERHEYAPAWLQGLPWPRPSRITTGWASPDGSTEVSEMTEYASYEAEVCPAVVVKRSALGELTEQTWRAEVPRLAGHLHCLEARTAMTGAHADPALNFHHEARLTRNASGLLAKLEAVGPGASLALQEIDYGPNLAPKEIRVLGRGRTLVEYEPDGVQLHRITAPDGSVTEVATRDPVSDQVTALLENRGATSPYRQEFRYDQLERLAKRWDSVGSGSETMPDQAWQYGYATKEAPAWFTTSQVVDWDNTRVRALRQTRELTTASGASVARAQLTANGWVFDQLTMYDRAVREETSWRRPPLAAGPAPSYSALVASAELVGIVRADGLGHTTEAHTRLHADVYRSSSLAISLSPGGVRFQSTDATGVRTTRVLDAGGRLVAHETGTGQIYRFGLDAAGRVRRVLLPGGGAQALDVDAFGRPNRVARAGLLAVDYRYRDDGLLDGKRFASPEGEVLREELFGYDPIGRQLEHVHVDPGSGQRVRYRYYYDGATPAQPDLRTARGRLTAVEGGGGYVKELGYLPDGKLASRLVHLAGWRTFDERLTLNEAGDLATRVVRILDGAGQQMSRTSWTHQCDNLGREEAVLLDDGVPRASGGAPPPKWLSYVHDQRGLLGQVHVLGGAASAAFTFDPVTLARVGVRLSPARGGPSQIDWRFDQRGFVGNERISHGGATLDQSYSYGYDGVLMSTSGIGAEAQYAYDGSALIGALDEPGAPRTLVAGARVINAGGMGYRLDGLGRVVARGALDLSYGPHGQVVRARQGEHRWDYLYDENGRRLLKWADGVPVAAYIDGEVLDAGGLSTPVQVGGHLVGLGRGLSFTPLLADARGTVLAAGDGSEGLQTASAYGRRPRRPGSAAVVDYAGQPYDADMGVIRMGVRDYDPWLGRFLTPDGAFLEEPERCTRSPAQCNLYGYAGGNPVNFVDPSGTEAEATDTAGMLSRRVGDIANVLLAGAGLPADLVGKVNFANSMVGLATAPLALVPTDNPTARLAIGTLTLASGAAAVLFAAPEGSALVIGYGIGVGIMDTMVGLDMLSGGALSAIRDELMTEAADRKYDRDHAGYRELVARESWYKANDRSLLGDSLHVGGVEVGRMVEGRLVTNEAFDKLPAARQTEIRTDFNRSLPR